MYLFGSNHKDSNKKKSAYEIITHPLEENNNNNENKDNINYDKI